MAAYTNDQDLEIYVRDVDRLPLPMTRFHEEAYREIRRTLIAQGASESDLDSLDATALEAIKVPSAHFVLYLFFSGFAGDPNLLETAKHHLDEFRRTVANLPLATTSGQTVSASSGKLYFG